MPDAQTNGARVPVYFDLDHTLINTSSGLLYYQFLWRLGRVSAFDVARAGWWMLLNRLNRLDVVTLAQRELRRHAGTDESAVRERMDEWFADYVQHRVYQGAVDALREHHAAGHHTAILSAASPYVCGPMTDHLEFDSFACTTPAVDAGKFTGEFVPPYCYGDGKVTWAERHCAEWGLDLDAAYFYSDSYSDLPMLERAKHPRIVNPDTQLRAHATQHGWPILKWDATV